jgi:hypothetical protein
MEKYFYIVDLINDNQLQYVIAESANQAIELLEVDSQDAYEVCRIEHPMPLDMDPGVIDLIKLPRGWVG